MDIASCAGLRRVLSRRGFLQVGPAGLLTAGLLHTLAQRAGAIPQGGGSHGGSATIYHALGVDPRAQLYDLQGQVRYISEGNPVLDLF